MNWKVYFSELLTEQKLYLCLLIHHVRHNSCQKGSSDSTRLSKQNSIGLRKPKPRTFPSLPALPILQILKWQHKHGAQVFAVTPAVLFSFLVPQTRKALLDLSVSVFFPALFLWWALCPESFYSSPWLSLLPFSDFRIPQCLYCAAHLLCLWWCAQICLQAWLCFFSAHSSLSQNPFFPPSSCVSVTSLLSAVPLRPLYWWAPVIARFKPCKDLFMLFLPSGAFQQIQSRNWHHNSLDFLLHLTPEKKRQQYVQAWGEPKLPGLCRGLSRTPRLLLQEQSAARDGFQAPVTRLVAIALLDTGRVSHRWDMPLKM